jgi:hypothetical protein
VSTDASRVLLPDGTARRFDNTGDLPMYRKAADGSWVVVATAEGHRLPALHGGPLAPTGLTCSTTQVTPARHAVINLADRPDRLTAFGIRWALAAGNLPITVFPAVDGRPERDPAYGCLRSHLFVLEAGPGPVLVLEDDAVFAPQFHLPLSAPVDWDVLWLGCRHRQAPAAVSDDWARITDVVCTHGYLARDPQRLAGMLRALRVRRIDPHIGALPLNQYCPRRHTIGQAAGESDINPVTNNRPAAVFWSYWGEPDGS